MTHNCAQDSRVDSSSSTTATEPNIPIRANHPRQLMVYKENGEWEATTDNKIIEKTPYLAVSYRQSDFQAKGVLENEVQRICDARELNGYWLDFACTGKTQEEKDIDLYRIADVFRYAKETVIMIPNNDDGWKSWGDRVWTYPEALLSKELLCKEGKKRVRRTTLREVANHAYEKDKDEEDRLVAIYDTVGKDFIRFRDRVRDLCMAIWSRSSGPTTSTITPATAPSDGPVAPKALPGERVYALMGFLQERITPKADETEKEAFDRLLHANELTCNVYPWEAVEKKKKLVLKDRSDSVPIDGSCTYYL